jgi:predicted nucleic acid-binding protein
MSGDRVFLDTSYIQALLNRRDQHHQRARALVSLTDEASEIWVTEAVLIEVADALSGIDRQAAVAFLDSCYREEGIPDGNIVIVTVDSTLLIRGLYLYASRPDKRWGLTDCISFVVMRDNGLIHALTADRHFVQAGFRALMLEEA